MERPIKLVGESASGGRYVFAYEELDKSGFVRDKNGFVIGFAYINDENGERRYNDRLIDAIANHAPWLFNHEPTTVFTPEELERIVNLPVYHG